MLVRVLLVLCVRETFCDVYITSQIYYITFGWRRALIRLLHLNLGLFLGCWSSFLERPCDGSRRVWYIICDVLLFHSISTRHT